jgi:hypothetical protein
MKDNLDRMLELGWMEDHLTPGWIIVKMFANTLVPMSGRGHEHPSLCRNADVREGIRLVGQ